MSVTDNIIAEVRGLGAYTLKATVARVKLNQNESPWDVSEEFKAKVGARVAAAQWNRYPDFHPEDVLRGLGALHGLSGENVLIGNGSNELIQALFAAIVGKGTRVAIPQPTFSLYRMMVAANQGEVIDVPLREDFTYDLAAWRELAERGDTHLLLCTPNNPTGSVVDDAFIRELAGLTERLVIVDEAYAQFGRHDLSALVAEFPNVIVLRTFSKAAGLAGIRFGYALASAELVPEIQKVKLPYNVGIFGLEVARLAIEEPDVFTRAASPLNQERTRIEDACQALPFEAVLRGMANFVVVKTARSSELFAFLFEKGILVRDIGGYPMLQNCLRISVGTPEENSELIAELQTFFDDARP